MILSRFMFTSFYRHVVIQYSFLSLCDWSHLSIPVSCYKFAPDNGGCSMPTSGVVAAAVAVTACYPAEIMTAWLLLLSSFLSSPAILVLPSSFYLPHTISHLSSTGHCFSYKLDGHFMQFSVTGCLIRRLSESQWLCSFSACNFKRNQALMRSCYPLCN